MAHEPFLFDEINRRLKHAANELRALAETQPGPAGALVQQAQKRVEASARVLALVADQQRLRTFLQEEDALGERVGREPAAGLFEELTRMVAFRGGPLSCGLLLEHEEGTRLAASAGWTDSFARWHDDLAAGPGRCPLLGALRSASQVAVDRIALAASWPEWRARALAQGWRSALGVAIAGQGGGALGVLIVYGRGLGMPTREVLVAERAARLVIEIIAGRPDQAD